MTDERNGQEDKFSERPIESNPFQPPSEEAPSSPAKRIPTDPSVFEEPWLKPNYQIDANPDDGPDQFDVPQRVDPENSAWDEPAISSALAGDVPDDAVTWIRYFHQMRAATSEEKTWLVTLAIAFVSGLCAVVGSFFVQSASGGLQVVAIVIGAPITEETLKIALIIYVVEKKPWLFLSATQILLCGVASGFMFAVLENLLYLNVYVPSPSNGLVQWRWTVCTALHTVCTEHVLNRYAMCTSDAALKQGR